MCIKITLSYALFFLVGLVFESFYASESRILLQMCSSFALYHTVLCCHILDMHVTLH